jgi:hypothetical protein
MQIAKRKNRKTKLLDFRIGELEKNRELKIIEQSKSIEWNPVFSDLVRISVNWNSEKLRTDPENINLKKMNLEFLNQETTSEKLNFVIELLRTEINYILRKENPTSNHPN